MVYKLSIFALLWCSFNLNLFCQEEEDDEVESPFSYGVNINAFFANKKTATLYDGTPQSTPFGIKHILTNPILKQRFDQYFVHPYDIAEFPIESRYQTSIELGIHLNYQFTSDFAVFMDVNATQIDYEQFFTMSIDDPSNQSVDPNYERFPIIGEETRFNLNIGTQLSMYYDENTNAYFSLFGNLNSVEMERNFIVIGNQQYDIFHFIDNDFNRRPGGVGFGLGSGLGVKFHVAEKLLVDLNYNLIYTRINMTEDLDPFGFQHTMGIRVLWN